MKKVAAILLAAGRGERARDAGLADDAVLPKQYRRIAGREVLLRTMAQFAGCGLFDPVVVVIRPEDRARYDRLAAALPDQAWEPVPGGETRQESVLKGLEALEARMPDAVLIHDAARPFVSRALLARVHAALDGHRAVLPALPVTDTLKETGPDGRLRTVPRGGLWAAQTPQGFGYREILEAHRAAARSGAQEFTDDAAIAEWHGLDVHLVEGERGNMKLTTPEDFAIAEKMLGGAELRVGQGFDVHAFADGDHVILCGVAIPFHKSLSGHSDADVAMHALTDALLGAIAEGDIGTHFPPSDPRWRGAASEIFLREAGARVRHAGGAILNADVTIICEAPKIGPHREAMRTRLAEILEIDPSRISVKATTSEGLGFTGRGEGIAAQASATVRLG